MEIRFGKREHLKEKPDQKLLGFGKYMTDYMFVMDWKKDEGWVDARIVPYEPITLDPACVVLHYAQETFEGLKAYRTAEGKIQLFRPEMNARRMIRSNERLCMPAFPEDMFVEAIKALVKVEEDWVPSEPDTSLYIRPFMFATESSLGVHMASAYKFVVICCPVGAYYPTGLDPVKIMVEDELVRAVKGGTGFTKCGGNYAGSILGQVKAEKMGYTQVLWLDGAHRNSGGGLRHRYGSSYLPGGRAPLQGRRGYHQRRQDRRSDPQTLQHADRHPVGTSGRSLWMDRGSEITKGESGKNTAALFADGFRPAGCLREISQAGRMPSFLLRWNVIKSIQIVCSE